MVRGLVLLVVAGTAVGWLRAHQHKRELHDHLHEVVQDLGRTTAEHAEAKRALEHADTNLHSRGRELGEMRTSLARVQQQLTACNQDAADARHQ